MGPEASPALPCPSNPPGAAFFAFPHLDSFPTLWGSPPPLPASSKTPACWAAILTPNPNCCLPGLAPVLPGVWRTVVIGGIQRQIPPCPTFYENAFLGPAPRVAGTQPSLEHYRYSVKAPVKSTKEHGAVLKTWIGRNKWEAPEMPPQATQQNSPYKATAAGCFCACSPLGSSSFLQLRSSLS